MHWRLEKICYSIRISRRQFVKYRLNIGTHVYMKLSEYLITWFNFFILLVYIDIYIIYIIYYIYIYIYILYIYILHIIYIYIYSHCGDIIHIYIHTYWTNKKSKNYLLDSTGIHMVTVRKTYTESRGWILVHYFSKKPYD